jgi:ParB family chromosome partitioning protein
MAITGDSAFAHIQSKSFEWYTPARYIEAARELMGGIDVDPASSALANTIVKATTCYDIDTNGLDKPWSGRVWLNPPYCRTTHISNQELWTCRLIAQYEAGITTQAVLLVNASTDTTWFQRLWNYPICFTDHRIFFWSVNQQQGGPTHGSAFVYFGTRLDRFISIFSRFGVVVRRVSALEPTLWSLSSEEGGML